MRILITDKRFSIGLGLITAAFIKISATFLLGYRAEIINTSITMVAFLLGFYLVISWKT